MQPSLKWRHHKGSVKQWFLMPEGQVARFLAWEPESLSSKILNENYKLKDKILAKYKMKYRQNTG